jgi:SAM-dependent methyltransferase
MPTPQEIRDAQRRTWAGLSTPWEKWDAVIVAQLQPVTTALVDRLAIAPDQHHLDIAAGTGEPGLTIAAKAPAGRVVLTDLAPEMLEVAARRAAAQGITNVETRACSAEELPFDDGSFDSVSVRFGFMFLPDLAAATAEIHRVLKPGGRVGAAVWIDPSANPWTSIAMQAIGTEVTLPAPDPDGPNMYRCAEPGRMRALFEDAGLIDVDEWEVPLELVTASSAQYWEVMSEHVSLVAAVLRDVDDEARRRIGARAIELVRPYQHPDATVHVPGLAGCIVGTKHARMRRSVDLGV